jgi:hypothetical protein
MKKQIFTIILLLMGGVCAFGQFKLDGGINSLRLQTNGVDRLYVAPNGTGVGAGNIGIGTFTPPAKLSVVGDMALQKIVRETSSGGFNNYDRQDASIAIFQNGGTITGIQGGSEGQLLYILCGYGTNQSALIISHEGTGSTASNRILTHTGADFTITGGAGGVLLIYDATKARWRIVETPSGSGTAGWGLTGNAGTNPATQFIGTTDAQGLILKTNNLERISVESSGDVGIGITAADSKLHVANGSAGVVTSKSGTVATFESNDNTFLSLLNPASGTGSILFGNPTNNSIGFLNYDHSVNQLRFGTNATTKMSILANGNVGINTIFPTAKLEVNGDIKVSVTTIAPTANSTLDPLDRQSKSYVSLNAAAGVITTISGITAPTAASGNQPYGTLLYISIGSGATVIFKNNASAVPANTINTYNNGDFSINGKGGIILIYDVDGWRMIGGAS